MMRRTVSICALWLAMSVPIAAQSTAGPTQWQLPRGLVEISGLAAASESTVFAHNDEHAIVYELSLDSGDVVRAFALGDPTEAGDFEGVAVYDGRIYLITSKGKLYEAEIGEHRGRVRYNVYDTGASETCEVEGLSRAPKAGEFLIACKRSKKGQRKDRVAIYRWSLADRVPQKAPAITINYRDFLPLSEREDFRPAGIEWDAATGTIFIVSSRSHIVYAFDEDGVFKRKIRLSKTLHRQSEGVALSPSGKFLIADEGAERGVGVLSVYNAVP